MTHESPSQNAYGPLVAPHNAYMTPLKPLLKAKLPLPLKPLTHKARMTPTHKPFTKLMHLSALSHI